MRVVAKTKVCHNCKKRKRLTSYYFANKKRTVRAVECKQCSSKRTTKLRRENPIRRLEIQRKSMYGVDSVFVEQLIAVQENKCAICGSSSPNNLDHDHATGKVRGMLCLLCNQGISRFKDNPSLLENAVAYLKKWV